MAYRLICLLDGFGKVLDGMMADRMVYFLKTNYFYSGRQYGFMEGRDNSDAVENIINKIKNNLEKGHTTCMVSLDVHNAFNTVWQPIVLSTLNKYDCPRNVWRLIRDSFVNRKIVCEEQSEIFSWLFELGCFQGSCSGPHIQNLLPELLLIIFWNLDEHVLLQTYADDYILLCSGSNRKIAERKTNECLRKIEE